MLRRGGAGLVRFDLGHDEVNLEKVIRTKRWNDPIEPHDGYRLLICRYRPRGVAADKETWNAWLPSLGPSVELHAAAYGKHGEPIAWDEYRARYFLEMKSQTYWIRSLGEREARGEMLTLLCSSACIDPERCHRTLLRELLLKVSSDKVESAKAQSTTGVGPTRRRRASP